MFVQAVAQFLHQRGDEVPDLDPGHGRHLATQQRQPPLAARLQRPLGRRVFLLEDVRHVVVAFRQQTPVYVGDVAEVREGVVDRTTLITGNGLPAANINVARQIRGNILDIAKGVEQTLRDNMASRRSCSNRSSTTAIL